MPDPVVPFEKQLGQTPLVYVPPSNPYHGTRYGGTLCSAVSGSRLAYWASKGKVNVTGSKIRSLTDEAVPDVKSPGLNMPQIDEALGDLGVYLDTRVGSRSDTNTVSHSVSWAEYEDRRMSGQGCIIQVGYGPIADSPMDAGNGFRGGHAIFENLHSTFESLADGRRAGVWKYDGRIYDRPIIRDAAAVLPIPLSNGTVVHPKAGYVWAAFSVDIVPQYVATVLPLAGQISRKVAVYTVRDGRIVGFKADTTKGIVDKCSPPQLIRKPGGGYRSLVKLLSGARAGKWVWSGWAHPV